MKKKTKTALEESIKKWEKNTEATVWDDVLISREDCALCDLFNGPKQQTTKSFCKGCPVYKKTGQKFCVGTPYIDVYDMVEWRDELNETDKENIKKEVEFLKSLREE